jgi:hypothetical protein
MNESDVTKIEWALGYSLPADYRTFLLNDTDEVNRLAELMPLRSVLWTNADEIVRENIELRKHASDMTIGEEQKAWPENYLVVGTNGGGDYWFIDRDGKQTGLWFWQHEMQDVELTQATFAEYLEQLRQDGLHPTRWQSEA